MQRTLWSLSTKLVKCHFVTKTCKKADWNNTQKGWNKEPSTEITRTAKEGSGDVRKTTEIVFHFSIFLQRLLRHLVQQNGMKLSLWGHRKFRLGLRPQFSLQVQHLRDCRALQEGCLMLEVLWHRQDFLSRDPPRMAGSYGVSLNDPVFGIFFGSIPCENPGHRPIPAQAPIPPVGDPVAQLLVGQGAMSHLLIQMAQEMNRRTVGQGAGDPSQSSGQGSTSGGRKEMKMDEKWIPSMPMASWKNWTSRGKELSGFTSWLEQFSGWLCLIHDAYGPELREAINSADPIRSFRDHDQTMRSKRLFHLLQQNFTGYSKIENLIKSQISALCENHARKMRTFFTRRLEPKTRSSYHIKWSNAKWNTLKQNTSSLLKTKLS